MEKLPDGTIEEILSFRNRFEQKMGAVRLSSERDMNIMEDRLFIDFLDALNYTGFVENFDYITWERQRSQVNSVLENIVEQVKNMDMEELRKLMTMHIRMERFSEGYMQKLYEDGFFDEFFNGLEELNDDSAK